jgi:hypothetical protein
MVLSLPLARMARSSACHPGPSLFRVIVPNPPPPRPTPSHFSILFASGRPANIRARGTLSCVLFILPSELRAVIVQCTPRIFPLLSFSVSEARRENLTLLCIQLVHWQAPSDTQEDGRGAHRCH